MSGLISASSIRAGVGTVAVPRFAKIPEFCPLSQVGSFLSVQTQRGINWIEDFAVFYIVAVFILGFLVLGAWDMMGAQVPLEACSHAVPKYTPRAVSEFSPHRHRRYLRVSLIGIGTTCGRGTIWCSFIPQAT